MSSYDGLCPRCQQIECSDACMQPKLTCTYQQAMWTLQDWHKLPKTGHHQRGNLRAGQYIWNKYGKGTESWPELYYCEHPEHVSNILYKHFH